MRNVLVVCEANSGPPFEVDSEGGESFSECLGEAHCSISGSGDHGPVQEPVHQNEIGDTLVVEKICTDVLERVEGFQGCD